jgi:uncharacterized protein YjbI with pentapeptide repeats
MTEERKAEDGPEPINLDRQNQLLERLTNHGRSHPFENFSLDGADMAWLIKWVSEDPFEDPFERRGLHLYRAVLEGVQLVGAQLEGAELIGANLEGANLARANLKGAYLAGANLKGANLVDADLEGVQLVGAQLEGADLRRANLAGAELDQANLAGADLEEANLEEATLSGANLEGAVLARVNLAGADLRSVFFDAKTRLLGVTLGNTDYGFVSVADTTWNGVNLAVVDWAPLLTKHAMLGDEQIARGEKEHGNPKEREKQIREYEDAVRANRQLALALGGQGLYEQAAHLAYRALTLQRKVLKFQRKYRSTLFSWLLDFVAGYGYKPFRCLLVYLSAQLLFTAAYLGLSYLVTMQHPDFWRALAEDFILSVTSFHGRAFLPQAISTPIVNDYLAYGFLASVEGVFGLLIEGIFVATLVQRFFK